MSRTAIEELLYLLDQGFNGNEEQSLMGNLRDVVDEDWIWRAPGSGRSIRDIGLHAATTKYVYGNQAFGDASVAWAAGSREIYSDAPLWSKAGHCCGMLTRASRRACRPSRTLTFRRGARCIMVAPPRRGSSSRP